MTPRRSILPTGPHQLCCGQLTARGPQSDAPAAVSFIQKDPRFLRRQAERIAAEARAIERRAASLCVRALQALGAR
ncbi:hypothetical protein [Ferrovibrio sp.]|uniref:hypothetical protein n=1 Tax=Ferrovibrio sp. TaxID=1917215 RepID=UPI0035AE377C